ncbi:SCP2 sterol-binding domain-containing protein [Micromonospora sp. CB01531]|uniref:SCP2 sterol-binding domain-containing protein n=1 Tax=Micromonospora sp. CB01531 TaxID=1718947 RepID=UPI00093DB697|nr:SCP2 sterol-binding domain-containing protein [Micromonospora sp. CB01531]
MSDRTAELFGGLGRRGHEPLLEEANAAVRFDLEHERGIDHWLLVIRNGDIRVSREDRGADLVVRVDRALFERIVAGDTNVYSAWLRHELSAEGDVRLARLIQRIIPGPSGARHPRAFAREQGQRT